MKLTSVLTEMRAGAVLRLSFDEHPTWELDNGVSVIRVSSRTVQAAIKRQAIVGVGDTLFGDIPSQTWRYAEPPA
jgi:hypothetical protein